MSLPARAQVREVGPRDGLQVEAPLGVGERVALIEALVDCGVADIEAVAFVSPRVVPSMAGASDVLASLRRVPGVRYWALVPNVRGAEMALDAGADGLSVTTSASEVYSLKNVGRSVEESVLAVGQVAALAGGRVPVDAVISCAFGSPYEGDVSPADVAALGVRLRQDGVSSVTFADTTGMATPGRIDALLAHSGNEVGLHLHDTRGTALVNAYAALVHGVVRFDTSVGGLGGSPVAGRAGVNGNLATEDLVYLLDDLGVATGIDLGLLLAASGRLSSMVGHAVPSRVAAAGRQPRTEG